METLSTALLNDIEAFLIARINVDIDGMPNLAMVLLQRVQDERATTAAEDQFDLTGDIR
jgi:hypothetical protein